MQYFDLNIALKLHQFSHTISQKLCIKVPVSGFFLSRYPYSIRDLILNKRTSKDARLTIFRMIQRVPPCLISRIIN